MSQRSSRQQSDAPPPAESVFTPDCILTPWPCSFLFFFKKKKERKKRLSKLWTLVQLRCQAGRRKSGSSTGVSTGCRRHPFWGYKKKEEKKGEGPVVIPFAFQIPSVSRISIQAAQRARTHTHTRACADADAHKHTQRGTMSPDRAKFTQLWSQELQFSLLASATTTNC